MYSRKKRFKTFTLVISESRITANEMDKLGVLVRHTLNVQYYTLWTWQQEMPLFTDLFQYGRERDCRTKIKEERLLGFDNRHDGHVAVKECQCNLKINCWLI